MGRKHIRVVSKRTGIKYWRLKKKPGPKKKGKWVELPSLQSIVDPDINPFGLSDKQLAFIFHYTDPDGEAYLDRNKAYVLAGYASKNADQVNRLSRTIIKTKKIQMALRELLQKESIDTMIADGVKKRLENPMTPYWQPTADFVAKVRGEFAPDKTVNLNLTPEDRDAKYEEIMKLVEGKRQTDSDSQEEQ